MITKLRIEVTDQNGKHLAGRELNLFLLEKAIKKIKKKRGNAIAALALLESTSEVKAMIDDELIAALAQRGVR